MTIKQLVQGMAVALPMMTLVACSTNQQTSEAGEAELSGQEQVGSVETGAVEPVLTAAEQIEQQKEALSANNIIYFSFDDSQISTEYFDVLNAHAEFLRENPSVSVFVEGHADERGTPEYNVALGERRSNAVSTYLQSLGVIYDQINVVSYGEEKPLDPGHTEAAWAKNRRAVLAY